MLLAVLLFGTVSGALVSAAEPISEYDKTKYDYSHKNAENTTLGALDVALDYLKDSGEAMLSAERDFLEKYNVLTLTYAESVTTEQVTLLYDSAERSLTVRAVPYAYQSGEKLFKWVPVSAKLGEKSLKLVDGECIFGSVGEGETVSVTFEAAIEISREDIGALINLYHDTARYVGEYDGYDDHMAAYGEYLIALRIYEEALAEYERYLAEYEEYLGELDVYLEYEESMREYWAAYEKYEEYLAALDKYGADKQSYAQYLEKLQLIKRQLKAFELVKVPMTDKRTVYSAVMGDLVDKVLENETALVEACGVDDPKIIWQAGDATERLRKLMTGYYAATDERAKYNYYLINYNNIKDSVHELVNALNKLYSYRKVRAMLIADEKDKKYIILVAQLALIANALTDGTLTDYDGKAAYGPTWKIEGTTISAILENKSYYDDKNDSSPLPEGYPAERSEPVPPTEVTKHVMPGKVAKPSCPTAVEHPGDAPETVNEPQLPEITNHFVSEILPRLPEEERRELRSAYDNGNTQSRTYPDTSYTLKPTAAVTRTVGKESVTVVFLSDTGAPIESHTVESGGRIVFESDLPFREEDEYNSYRFAGWRTALGEELLIESVTQSCEVYPYFEKAPKYYNVTWSVNGTVVTERLISDIIPECPIPTEKAGDLQYYYVFDGWDKELEPVGRDITYTAVFKRCYVVEYEGGGASVKDDGARVVCDARGEASPEASPIRIGALLELISGKRALTLVTVRGNIEFSFAETLALISHGVDAVAIESRQVGSVSNIFTVRLFSNGNEISEPLGFGAELYHNVENSGNLKLLKNGSLKNSVKMSLSDSKIAFSMESGVEYKLRPVYDLNVISDTGVMIVASNVYPEPGETVSIRTQYLSGYAPRTLEVIDKSTGENILEPDGTFRMPASDVTVRGTSVRKTYTVLFLSDGKVISSATYTHGEKVNPPTTPTKETDGNYVYTFVTWSPDVTSYITEDATYSAVWHTEPIPEKVDDGEIKLSDGVRKLLFMACCAIVIFAAGVIPCIVLTVVLGVKHKRRVNLWKMNKNAP